MQFCKLILQVIDERFPLRGDGLFGMGEGKEDIVSVEKVDQTPSTRDSIVFKSLSRALRLWEILFFTKSPSSAKVLL